MRLLGIPGCHTRPPFQPLDASAAELVATSMRALDLPEWRGRLA
jgi:hypothetical protein